MDLQRSKLFQASSLAEESGDARMRRIWKTETATFERFLNSSEIEFLYRSPSSPFLAPMTDPLEPEGMMDTLKKFVSTVELVCEDASGTPSLESLREVSESISDDPSN